jgi:GTP-binding protein LepA
MSTEMIRNFSIIAHIDHGKSTLSDRIIEKCIKNLRNSNAQMLDSMDIERERGITIKSQTVRLDYTAKDGKKYILNLMDTPGHVDFGYEVSRSLAACEGSLLLVDATQGVEAQTLSNSYKAIEQNHEIIPILNKIDLPTSNIEDSKKQIENIIGIDASEALMVSGKTGEGVDELLEEIVAKIPHPKGYVDKPLKALLVDAWYDNYLGVIALVKVEDGVLKTGMKIKMLSNGKEYEIERVGYFILEKITSEQLSAGEIGFFCAGIKEPSECNIGDTIVEKSDTQTTALPGFKKNQPTVFCGLFPIDASDYQDFKEALMKLRLNDSSIEYEYESSNALGFGFRCGFLGLLHMDITNERLEREFGMNLIATAPSVVYRVNMRDGTTKYIRNVADFPSPDQILSTEEPMANINIITRNEYVGDIIKLCFSKRGEQKNMNFSDTNRVTLEFLIPLAEIISNFYDTMISLASGHVSSEWSLANYQKADIVKVTIMVNGDPVDALSFCCHKTQAEYTGRNLLVGLKKEISRQMFQIALQAGIGGKIIARETISPLRKDVTAKCYGGDITRKRKLLEKQKEGKKKMKMIGSVEIPQKAFLSILKINSQDN